MGLRGGGIETSAWHGTQHSTTTSSLGIFHPDSRGPARSERAFVSPLLARFRGSYPCRARSPPSSAAPLTQSSHARLPVPRPPLCPPEDAWAERESRAPESSGCTPGTRSVSPDLERAPHAWEHPSRICERGERSLELRVAGEEDHRVLSLRCPSRSDSSLPRAGALIPGAWRGKRDDLHSVVPETWI